MSDEDRRRADAATLHSFLHTPSSFLRDNTVNSFWAEAPNSAENRSQQAQDFFLVEQGKSQRPGRILGSWRMHDVNHYVLTNNAETAGQIGRVVGHFQAPQLAMRQAAADDAPNLPAIAPSALDTSAIPNRKTIHTMDLSGCTIKREANTLFHVQPKDSGLALQGSLGAHTFGPQQYGGEQHFVMFRKKDDGRLKYYAQSMGPDNTPQLKKGHL